MGIPQWLFIFTCFKLQAPQYGGRTRRLCVCCSVIQTKKLNPTGILFVKDKYNENYIHNSTLPDKVILIKHMIIHEATSMVIHIYLF